MARCCNKLVNIATGVTSLATGTNEALGNQRLLICNPCAERAGVFCSMCACVIKLKVRVPNEQCPIGKWGIAV